MKRRKLILVLTFGSLLLVLSGIRAAHSQNNQSDAKTTGTSAQGKEERKGATPEKITKACKNKRPGDIVKVRGEEVTCQTPMREVVKACKNKEPGVVARVPFGPPREVMCPPACCYINGCIYPQNRDCL